MEDKNVLFSTSLFGFGKKNVISYIADLNRDFTQKSAEMADENTRLKSEIEVMKSELEQMKSEIFEAKDSLDVYQSKAENASAALSSAENHIAILENELGETKAALELVEKNKDSDIQTVKDASVAERVAHEAEIAKIREEYRVQLADLGAEVDKIREEYRLKEEENYTHIKNAAFKMRDSMAVELRKVTKDCLREVLRGIECMKSDNDSMSENAYKNYNRMNESIDTFESRMKDEIRRILEEFRNGDLTE